MSEAPEVAPTLGPDEFVALALAGPIESGPAKYGYSLRVASGNPRPPGIIALTWITGKDAADRERIRAHAKQNVQDFLKEPGFISIVTGFVGLRGFTVTAWEDEAAMRRARASTNARLAITRLCWSSRRGSNTSVSCHSHAGWESAAPDLHRGRTLLQQRRCQKA